LKTITIIGVNYYPEDTAIGLYSTQMAEYLSQRGYKVNVITGFPYYPQWEIKETYKKKSNFYKEEHNNISIYRYKQYVPKNQSFFKRIIHLTDFTLGSLINCFKIKKSDLVIAVVPFTSAILLGWVLKRRLRAKLWTHIQDFEFDAALQAGVSQKKNNLLFKGLFKLEKYLLNKSDCTSTISFSMLNKLKSKTNSSVYYFPNWIDNKMINPNKSKQHPYFSQNKKFKVLYAGNIGEKQNWHFFVSFLEELKKYKDVEVIIVGQGSKKKWLFNKIDPYSFIKILNPVPLKELNDLLCSADLHILFQKDDVLDTVMPSKILGMMASKKPSLITGHVESEVFKIMDKSQGGVYLPNNITKVANAFNNFYLDKNIRLEMGINAQKYVTKNYNRDSILSDFEREIKILLNSKD